MSAFLKIYMFLWIVACSVAIILIIKQRYNLELFRNGYWQLLFQKWKLVTFVIALVCITIVAPYSGDPTWDYMDAIFMSILAFLTAPWVIGVLFRFIRYEKLWTKLYIVVCTWMFSTSWFYDGYLLLRDGNYPMTWYSNIFASSILYLCAGLFWSLEWKERRDVYFSFTEKEWLQAPAPYSFVKIAWYGFPFVLLVAVALGSFLI